MHMSIKKVRAASRKYRNIQAALDRKGIVTSIQRSDKKSFTLIVNYESIRSYKTRRSCNRYLKKLLDQVNINLEIINPEA